MPTLNSIARVVDLLDPNKNVLYDVSVDDARAVVAGGDADAIGRIGGQFALVGRDGTTVRMARTIGRIMRYFIAKRAAGPALIVSDRIDAIQRWLDAAGLGDQFHPSYTRMVPAHHLVEIRLVGCPDPNPAYARFFRPPPPHSGELPADLDVIGKRYVQAVQAEMVRWLGSIPPTAPIGVAFSGGIDSGSVFLLAYDAVRRLGMNPSRLKAFTLSVDGGGEDAA